MIYIRTLLGKYNLDFSINCLKSCVENCIQETCLEIFEDGTLTTDLIDHIQLLIPNAVIKSKSLRDEFLKDILDRYPASKRFRQVNVLGYKLFDVMLYEKKDFFYIDSDIFFYRKFSFPVVKNNPVFMMDSESAYVFSNAKTYQFADRLLPRINSGFYYFPLHLFKMEIIESFLIQNYPLNTYPHHWAEQTIWSVLANLYQPAYYFDSNQIIMASTNIALNENLIAIHYSRPYRVQMECVNKKIKKMNLNNHQHINIRLIIISKFSFIMFLITKYQNKVFRRLKGVSNMRHK